MELLSEQLGSIPSGKAVIVYDETGKKGHQALRTLVGAGFSNVTNISGGHTSLQRHARAIGFKNIQIDLLPIEAKKVEKEADVKEVKEVNEVKADRKSVV